MVPITCMHPWCLYAQVKFSNVDLSFYIYFVLCYKLFINF